jgi:hypothetical protein
MKNGMAWIAALVTLAAPGIALAETPDQVEVRSVGQSGTGCGATLTTATFTSDREWLLLFGSDLSARTGPGVLPAEGRVFCQVLVDLDYPDGWQYAVEPASGYTSSLELDADVVATLHIDRWFTGAPAAETMTFEQVFRGPASSALYTMEQPAPVLGPWSPCGAPRALNVRTEARVSRLQNPSGTGAITISPPWGIQTLHLRWQRC